ncbi:MAG: hypothetical protein ACWGQW_00140 [bacterium]
MAAKGDTEAKQKFVAVNPHEPMKVENKQPAKPQDDKPVAALARASKKDKTFKFKESEDGKTLWVEGDETVDLKALAATGVKITRYEEVYLPNGLVVKTKTPRE